MGDKVGYAIVKEEHTIKKKILPQNTVFSAEQSAIIGEIQSKKNSRHEIMIITDFLSTIIAAESHTPTKNPKTQTIGMMLDQEGPKITLLWVPSHKWMAGNEKADEAAKETLDEDIPNTERYPPEDLRKWLTEEDFKKIDQRWKNWNNKMKEKKLNVDRKEDTKGMPSKDQVRTTHGSKMEGVGNPLCPFLQHRSI
jgi:hypothetical protein